MGREGGGAAAGGGVVLGVAGVWEGRGGCASEEGCDGAGAELGWCRASWRKGRRGKGGKGVIHRTRVTIFHSINRVPTLLVMANKHLFFPIDSKCILVWCYTPKGPGVAQHLHLRMCLCRERVCALVKWHQCPSVLHGLSLTHTTSSLAPAWE